MTSKGAPAGRSWAAGELPQHPEPDQAAHTYIYIYITTFTCVYIYIYTCIYIYIYTCTYICICIIHRCVIYMPLTDKAAPRPDELPRRRLPEVCRGVHIYIYIYIYTYISLSLSLSLSVYIYIYRHVYIYIYMYIDVGYI